MSAGPAPVRFGFVGAGMVATTALAPAVHAADGAVLAAAAARDRHRAAALEPGRVLPAYRDVVADDGVDVVYVSLSNEAHLPWALAALEAGKHVLVEKPLALDAGEVARLVDAARAADRLLVEAVWFRWHPRTRRLADLVAAGVLGEIARVEASFCFDGGAGLAGNYRLDPARGGGALYDTGCYALSAVQLVLGPDAAVEDAAATTGPTGVDLATSARLVGRGGGRAEVRCAMNGPDEQVLRVTGSQAAVEFTTGEAFTAWRTPAGLRLTGPDGTVRDEAFEPVDAYRLMVESVAAAVRGEPAHLVTAAESLALATTMDAVRLASLKSV